MKKAKWLGIAKLLAPLVIGMVKPGLAPIAGKITDAINEAENLHGDNTAKEKLAHVINMANDAADVVNEAKGREIINKEELASAVTEVTEAVVSVTNTIHSKVK